LRIGVLRIFHSAIQNTAWTLSRGLFPLQQIGARLFSPFVTRGHRTGHKIYPRRNEHSLHFTEEHRQLAYPEQDNAPWKPRFTTKIFSELQKNDFKIST
jgi:hypothetical protein